MDPRIGPHEGREFELLDEGEKHVAYFHDIIPTKYDEYAMRPEFGSIEWDVVTKPDDREILIPYRILYRQTHAEEAARLYDILRNYDCKKWQSLEREIGAILGYSEGAVEYYIKRIELRQK